MNKAMMAAVGDRDSVMLWNSVGVKTVYASTQQQVEQAVNSLAKQGAAVIFITEQAAALVPETLDRYKTVAFPAIIPIPGAEGSDGTGIQNLYSNIEKAIGTNILFEEAEQ